ncbi:MAG TPA: sensor histidine kinase [Bdellovibrionales bacterium]|nr:sensor histidine kinase [Bdellovibrionales bacterium]
MAQAQEDERLRISRTLHDELGQNLALLKLKLSGVEYGESHELLSIVDDTIERLRRVAFEIRPLLLDELGLVHAIKRKLSELHRATGLKIFVEQAPEDLVLGEPYDLSLYRIVQESLNNVVRHARATEVVVSLRRKIRSVHLEVRDNGAGYKPATGAARGMGLATMKERAELLGGHFQIEAIRGGGTIIQVEIPLPEATAE